MLTFIPPYMGEEIKSNAEKKVFEILQDLQLENAVILHSLGLPKHKNKVYGEIDFVIVCNKGIACLEIKGGRVECKQGQWFFTDRHGVERKKNEGPFAQVSGNMFSMINIIKDKFKNYTRLQNTFCCCGVMFPDIEFKSCGQEIIPEIIFDSKTKNITDYINGLFHYWEKRNSKSYPTLSPTDIKTIVDFLRGDFTFIPLLRDKLNYTEKKLIRLTNEQTQIINALSSNKHLLIEGGAGTGKTLLAMDYAQKQAELGKKVLYLTYNKNLVQNIKNQITNNENIKIINIHALFGEYINVTFENKLKDQTQYFNEILPEEFYQYVSNLTPDKLENMQFDVLIMDEGQDIINPHYLPSLDIILKHGFENGQWAIFYDEKQNIYNPTFTDGMELIKSYQSTFFPLYINCRNTIQIGKFSTEFSGIAIKEFIQEQGEEVQKISFTDLNEFSLQLKEIIKKLQKECIEQSEIIFLSPKKYENSSLNKISYKVNELGNTFDPQSKLPLYATIQGYKGLDSKIVILIDIDKIYPQNFSKFLYIASTRARTLLYVIAPESFWEKQQ